MKASHYEFEPTGCPWIDEILDEVTSVTQMYPAVLDWNEEIVSGILKSAREAGDEIDRLNSELAERASETGQEW